MQTVKELKIQMEKSKFYKCPKCPCAFVNRNHLRKHGNRHKKIFLTHVLSAYVKVKRVKTLECNSCRQIFLSKRQLLLHRVVHVNKSVQYATESKKHGSNGIVKPFKCPDCDSEFVAKSTLEAHAVVHQPFPYICFCEIGYYQLQDLVNHKKIVHSDNQQMEAKIAITNNINKSPQQNKHKKPEDVNSKPGTQPLVQIIPSLPLLDITFEKTKDNRRQCPECLKTFADVSNAKLHYRTIHRKERPHVCHLCSKAFSQPNTLKNHLLIHAGVKDHTCQYCGKAFRTNDLRLRHERVHTGVRPFKCSQCEKAFNDPSAYTRHKRIHSGYMKYKCEHCPKAFTDSSAMYIHRKRHLEKRDFKCEQCGKRFFTKSDRKNHIEVHSRTKRYTCQLCFKKFKRKVYLQTHIKLVHDRKDHTCCICYKQFSTIYKLRDHKLHHSGIKKFECDTCSMKYYTKEYLRDHILKKHLFVKCDLCKRFFTCTRDLENHKLKESAHCGMCDKEFFCKCELWSHYKKVHTNTQRYECDYCGKVFVKYIQIKTHILNHIKQKYLCDLCGRCFDSKDAITNHMYKHLNVLRCNVCYKRFYSIVELQNHKNTSCTAVKYTCQICDKSLRSSSSLVNHLKLHMDHTKYGCPVCPKKL